MSPLARVRRVTVARPAGAVLSLAGLPVAHPAARPGLGAPAAGVPTPVGRAGAGKVRGRTSPSTGAGAGSDSRSGPIGGAGSRGTWNHAVSSVSLIRTRAGR